MSHFAAPFWGSFFGPRFGAALHKLHNGGAKNAAPFWGRFLELFWTLGRPPVTARFKGFASKLSPFLGPVVGILLQPAKHLGTSAARINKRGFLRSSRRSIIMNVAWTARGGCLRWSCALGLSLTTGLRHRRKTIAYVASGPRWQTRPHHASEARLDQASSFVSWASWRFRALGPKTGSSRKLFTMGPRPLNRARKPTQPRGVVCKCFHHQACERC